MDCKGWKTEGRVFPEEGWRCLCIPEVGGPGGAWGDPASSESSSRLDWEQDGGESSHLPRQTRGPAGEEQGVSATPTAFQKEDGGVFPAGSVAKNPPQRRRHGFDPWSVKIPQAAEQLSRHYSY